MLYLKGKLNRNTRIFCCGLL